LTREIPYDIIKKNEGRPKMAVSGCAGLESLIPMLFGAISCLAAFIIAKKK
jgi:hypothetical protein